MPNSANRHLSYNEFLYEMQCMIGSMFTPDGADWGEANLKEMQELIEEINELS